MQAQSQMRISSVTPMKDEAPFLLEWVAYHRLIGINDILVFSNGCTDGTDLMLERLDELGVVRHFPNPSTIMDMTKHHLAAIRYINTSRRLFRSDWVVSLDVDEFICVNVGAGRLSDLFAAVGDANVISMSQHNFGSSGLRTYHDKLVIGQFRNAADQQAAYHPRLNRRGTKTLTHMSAGAHEFHNHSPIFHRNRVDQVRLVNGSGEPLSEADLTRDIKSLTAPHYGFDLVQLNHYALKTMETFLLKAARGNANHADADYALPYWRKYDQNEMADLRILRWMDRVAQERDRLLQDPELRKLHEAAVLGAKARIADLKEKPEFARLFDAVQAAHRTAIKDQPAKDQPGKAPTVKSAAKGQAATQSSASA